MVLSISAAERFDFEVIKSKVPTITRGIVALAVCEGNPPSIEEQQKHIPRVDVLKVDQSFSLFVSKY